MHIGAARWVLSLHQALSLSNFGQTQSLRVREYGTNFQPHEALRLVSVRRSGPLF
jgi:hypothetical protein